jgi:hypothetical protein
LRYFNVYWGRQVRLALPYDSCDIILRL